MDSMRVSEAPDPGSIPGEATDNEAADFSGFFVVKRVGSPTSADVPLAHYFYLCSNVEE
jgi:hypothetical protein